MEGIDDDFFSDDGFDDIPPDALQQLEHDAFLATQLGQQTQERAELVPETRLNWAPRDITDRYPQNEPTNAANATLQPPAQLHTGLTNDYGALDVGELDAEVFDDDPSPEVVLDKSATFQDRPSHYAPDTIVLDEDEEGPMETGGGLSALSDLHKDHQLLEAKVVQ